MKRNFISSFVTFILIVTILDACKKDYTTPPVITETPVPVVLAPAKGEYVLSEGGFGGNNTKLAYYTNSTGTSNNNFFGTQNPGIPAGLGDLGNDMIIYGSKLYIVINNSGRVTVLNASNAVFIQNISFMNGAVNKLPRYAAAANGKVYVTSTDNTVSVIDTTSLTIVKTIAVGANPEGIAVASHYLYVANSGGYNPAPDSTVSVIDLNTESEIKKIKVGVNPYRVDVNSIGFVYVSAYGNFSSIPASVSVIDGNAAVLSSTLGIGYQYSNVRIANNTAYFYNNYGGVGTAKVFNTLTGTVIRNEFVTDGTVITAPYGINADELTGDVYIADAGNFVSPGTITCFSSAGVKKFSFSLHPV